MAGHQRDFVARRSGLERAAIWWTVMRAHRGAAAVQGAARFATGVDRFATSVTSGRAIAVSRVQKRSLSRRSPDSHWRAGRSTELQTESLPAPRQRPDAHPSQ